MKRIKLSMRGSASSKRVRFKKGTKRHDGPRLETYLLETLLLDFLENRQLFLIDRLLEGGEFLEEATDTLKEANLLFDRLARLGATPIMWRGGGKAHMLQLLQHAGLLHDFIEGLRHRIRIATCTLAAAATQRVAESAAAL